MQARPRAQQRTVAATQGTTAPFAAPRPSRVAELEAALARTEAAWRSAAADHELAVGAAEQLRAQLQQAALERDEARAAAAAAATAASTATAAAALHAPTAARVARRVLAQVRELRCELLALRQRVQHGHGQTWRDLEGTAQAMLAALAAHPAASHSVAAPPPLPSLLASLPAWTACRVFRAAAPSGGAPHEGMVVPDPEREEVTVVDGEGRKMVFRFRCVSVSRAAGVGCAWPPAVGQRLAAAVAAAPRGPVVALHFGPLATVASHAALLRTAACALLPAAPPAPPAPPAHPAPPSLLLLSHCALAPDGSVLDLLAAGAAAQHPARLADGAQATRVRVTDAAAASLVAGLVAQHAALLSGDDAAALASVCPRLPRHPVPSRALSAIGTARERRRSLPRTAGAAVTPPSPEVWAHASLCSTPRATLLLLSVTVAPTPNASVPAPPDLLARALDHVQAAGLALAGRPCGYAPSNMHTWVQGLAGCAPALVMRLVDVPASQAAVPTLAWAADAMAV